MDWPTEHLIEAAERWTGIGNRWTEAFIQVWQDSFMVDWESDAAAALQNRTGMDKEKVKGLAERAHEAARLARSGASDLEAASARVRYAVEDARAAGFDVGEDLSVTDRHKAAAAAERAARQEQARIRTRSSLETPTVTASPTWRRRPEQPRWTATRARRTAIPTMAATRCGG